MSTHTTYFCDFCNQDHTNGPGEDDGDAVTYTELPTYDGWAVFETPYVDSLGYNRKAEVHICARCLADPDFEQKPTWSIPDWDEDSRKNFLRGRKQAVAFVWAQDNLGTPDRWGVRGVRQVYGSYAYGFQPGPKMADGRFATADPVRTGAATS